MAIVVSHPVGSRAAAFSWWSVARSILRQQASTSPLTAKARAFTQQMTTRPRGPSPPSARQAASTIMAAPTVRFVDSSIRMNPPVVRLRR